MGAGTTAIIIIAVVAIIFLVANSQITGVNDFIQQIQIWLAEYLHIGNLPNNATGTTALGFTIFYTDGTHDDINQGAFPFSLTSLSIFYQNKNVSAIEIDVRAKLGVTATAWQSHTNISITYIATVGNPKGSETTISQAGSIWTEGDIVYVAKLTLQANQLTYFLNGNLENVELTYDMKVTATVALTATIMNIPTDFISTPVTGDITIGATPHGFSITMSGEGLINP